MRFPRFRALPPTSGLILVMTLLNIASLHSAGQMLQQTQDALTLKDAKVVVEYGRTITFTARIETALAIEQASILIKVTSQEIPRMETITVKEDGSIRFIYDSAREPLPPFGAVLAWVQVVLEDGKTYSSEPIRFSYNDDRFAWQVINHGNLNVHWYAGEDSFGAQALNAAVLGLAEIRGFHPTAATEPIHIYIYSNPVDLQDALAMGGETWAAGHTPPGLDAILVAIEPGPNQSFEMNTEIPHELAHWVLFRTLREDYDRQPVWLLEGMTYAAELEAHPDHASALQTAHRTGALLPFMDLCASFPAEAGGAFLAYAQSGSFVNHLRKTYGDAVLVRLTQAYRERGPLDDANCALGSLKALGVPLEQLDENWRESLPLQEYDSNAVHSLAPFIAVMALILIVPLWGALEQTRKRRKHGPGSS